MPLKFGSPLPKHSYISLARRARLLVLAGVMVATLGAGELTIVPQRVLRDADAEVRIRSLQPGEVAVLDATALDADGREWSSRTRFRADEKYTVFVHDGQEYMMDESLSALESRLGRRFFRCHRSELIALAAVRRLRKADDGHEVELVDGQVARISRRSLTDLKAALGI